LAQLHNLFDNYNCCVAAKDINNQYVYINPYSMTTLNFKNIDAMIGKTDTRLPWSEFSDLYEEHDNATLQGDIFYQVTKGCTFQKDLHTVLAYKTLLKNENNEPTGTLGIYQIFCQNNLFNLFNTIHELSKKAVKIKTNFEIDDNKIKFTIREKECLFYLLQGMSSKLISKKLQISSKTVEFHLAHIKDKLNCKNKTDIFSAARELGYFNIMPLSVLNGTIMNPSVCSE
ncbi:MAG: LuxR C-terminal-related transcriptional regulator, partial [Gammaproteobacteria bacterium]